MAVCGPYGLKYTWATAAAVDAEKPCAWMHDLTAGSVIKAGPDVSFIVTAEDLSSAKTLRGTAVRLLNLLSKPVILFRAKSDPPDPDGGQEDNAAESQTDKPLIVVAHGLSGVVVKQVSGPHSSWTNMIFTYLVL